MAIEEEIKQTSFISEYHKLIINLVYTSSWCSLVNIKFLQPFDISPQQFNVLRILRGRYPEPASISLIQERMLDKTSNASRLVEKLRLKKLVKRTINKSDRRIVDVAITESGLYLLNEIDKVHPELEANFKNLTLQEAHEMNRLLDKLRNTNDCKDSTHITNGMARRTEVLK